MITMIWRNRDRPNAADTTARTVRSVSARAPAGCGAARFAAPFASSYFTAARLSLTVASAYAELHPPSLQPNAVLTVRDFPPLNFPLDGGAYARHG